MNIDILFDGPPGPVSGRFVEVESPAGVSIKFGSWVRRDDAGDDWWALRIGTAEFAAVRLPLERRVAQLEAEAGHHDHWHAFGARVWRWLDENWDTEDGWELAEIAVLSGLAEHVKYDPDIHGACEAEPGDDIIYPLRGDPAFATLAGAP